MAKVAHDLWLPVRTHVHTDVPNLKMSPLRFVKFADVEI